VKLVVFVDNITGWKLLCDPEESLRLCGNI